MDLSLYAKKHEHSGSAKKFGVTKESTKQVHRGVNINYWGKCFTKFLKIT